MRMRSSMGSHADVESYTPVRTDHHRPVHVGPPVSHRMRTSCQRVLWSGHSRRGAHVHLLQRSSCPTSVPPVEQPAQLHQDIRYCCLLSKGK